MPFRLSAIPSALEWRLPPKEWAADDDGLSISAGARTDLFVDPESGKPTDSAPVALFTPPDPSFRLSARVAVAFGATFDAGVIHVWIGDRTWAKLCYELSPQGRPTIVSVVTRGLSDDCNSMPQSGAPVYLRVSQLPRSTAFHWSSDGTRWDLVRYFTLGEADGLRVGFSSQSPTGPGCRSAFSEIRYLPGAPSDLRNGE